MSQPQKNSVYHRNLKARLRLMRSPSFWAGLFGLSLVFLFAWQYFTNPVWIDFIVNFGNSINGEKTAQKDNDTESDVDKKPANDELGQLVLETGISDQELKEINAENADTTENTEEVESIFTIPTNKQTKLPQTSTNKNGELFTNKPAQTYPSFVNPFVTNAQRTLSTSSLFNPDSNSVNNNIPQTSVANTNSVNQSETQTQLTLNNSNTNVPVNPINNLGGNTSIQPQINNPSVNVINPPSNNLNSFTYLVQPQTAPISNIPAPLNVPVQQIAPVNTNIPVYSTNINSVPTNNITPGVGASALQPSQIEPPQIYQPSSPMNNNSNLQGKPIGNGEINTFSNP